ncbi:hypothetical protein OWV82_013338 [Melia azedarach]|uniref:Uncharacterized protein n=1 Tax=Melia azedarach TaxID=155640 RepID=A0ACC1XTU5_MELAZ|nr:hypothetical protein OWV82_013338 [Melia azedarach]
MMHVNQHGPIFQQPGQCSELFEGQLKAAWLIVLNLYPLLVAFHTVLPEIYKFAVKHEHWLVRVVVFCFFTHHFVVGMFAQRHLLWPVF